MLKARRAHFPPLDNFSLKRYTIKQQTKKLGELFLEDAYHQSAGPFRQEETGLEDEVTGVAILPAEARGLHPCNDRYPQEAELGFA
jgi:hypothetical protein